jgi:hypothetical protein
MAPQVAGAAALWGNRVAARAAGNGRLLAAHAEGRAGERLVLSELRAGPDGRWQARALGGRRHRVPSTPSARPALLLHRSLRKRECRAMLLPPGRCGVAQGRSPGSLDSADTAPQSGAP